MGVIAPASTCGSYLRLSFWTFVCLASFMTGHVHSRPTGRPSTPYATLFQRQDTLNPTTSFNWWPYPSWGSNQVSSTSAAASASATPNSSSTLAPDVDAMSSTLSSGAVMPTTAVRSALALSATTTSTSSVSLIHITALPPASTESSITLARARAAQSKSSNAFNFAYLAPLFAVLGVVIGALFTWIIYRYLRTRDRNRSRESVLVPGPPYTPPSRFRRETPASAAPLMAEEEPASTSRSGGWTLRAASSNGGRTKTGWLARALSSRRGVPSRSAPEELVEMETSGVGEDDPFLGVGNSSVAEAPSNGAVGRRGTVVSAASRQLTSPDPYDALSDSEDAPYETIRHKSIKRAILDRLRLGTLRKPDYERGQVDEEAGEAEGRENRTATQPGVQYRRGHKRSDSDAKLDVLANGTPTSSRRPTFSRNRSQLITSPPGFRMFVEDPESGALFSEDRPFNPSPSPSSRKARNLSDMDKFTPLPVRHTPEEKRNTLHTSSTTDVACHASSGPAADHVIASFSVPVVPLVRQVLHRVDSSMLPASPPLLTSPPLESQLFFGSTAPLHIPQPAKHKAQRSPQCGAGSPNAATGSPGGQRPNKLRTQRSPPLLPFPSKGSSSPFRGRLKKAPSAKPLPSSPPQIPERSDSGSSSVLAASSSPGKPGHGTPAERYHARRTALNKVDEILLRSWSEREVAESPNNFGAFLPPVLGASFEKEISGVGDEVKVALKGAGIEQRLEALRRP